MMDTELSSFLYQTGGSPLGSLGMMLPLVLIFGVFYLLLILPQQRRQKRWQHMINELKTGDRVTTQGGIRGSIIALKEDAVHLRVAPDNLRMEVAKSAIVSVIRDDEPKKSEK
ncbi:MAG TPA: preprotein translocase subunit YajC [Terriglobales bacterium]